MARDDLAYAVTCLGKEGSVDFLDSSRVGITILDFYININETSFLTYDQYTKAYPVPPPPKTEFGATLFSPKPIAETKFDDWFNYVSRDEKPVELAVFGTHATLSLEPVHMLKEFVGRRTTPSCGSLSCRITFKVDKS